MEPPLVICTMHEFCKNIKNNQPISFYIVVVYVLLQLEVRDKVIGVSAIVIALPSEPIAWSRALNVASPLQQLPIAHSKVFFSFCKIHMNHAIWSSLLVVVIVIVYYKIISSQSITTSHSNVVFEVQLYATKALIRDPTTAETKNQ